MPGRRRTKRFLIATPVDAALCVQHTVVVDRYVGDEMWITTDFPAVRNDQFRFSRVGSNPASNFRLRVADSEPVVVDGIVRHRVRLTSDDDGGPMAASVVGTLAKTVRVRLLEISETGCLLESPCRLDESAAGELRIEIDGECWTDRIRIRHCSRRASDGGCVFLTGAEFIWRRPFHDLSLRDVVGSAPREEEPASSDALPKTVH